MRTLLVLAAASGFLSVALGAFGAHGLKSRFAGLADGAQRLEWWQTAASYQLAHALAIAVTALVAARAATTAASVAGFSFAVGTLLFSGSLYVMALSGVRALGAVTPFGGLALLVGWGALAVAALRS